VNDFMTKMGELLSVSISTFNLLKAYPEFGVRCSYSPYRVLKSWPVESLVCNRGQTERIPRKTCMSPNRPAREGFSGLQLRKAPSISEHKQTCREQSVALTHKAPRRDCPSLLNGSAACKVTHPFPSLSTLLSTESTPLLPLSDHVLPALPAPFPLR
jgi:hypothetical protein